MLRNLHYRTGDHVSVAPIKKPAGQKKPVAGEKTTLKKPSSSARPSFASQLLGFEGTVREITNEKKLVFHLCNESRHMLGFRQAFFLKRKKINSPLQVTGISSIAVIDRTVPLVRWVEKIAANLERDVSITQPQSFSLPAYCDKNSEELKTYPFSEFYWVPFMDGDVNVGGVIFTKETPWQENQLSLGKRIAALYAHSWRAIKGKNKILKKRVFTKKKTFLLSFLLGIIAFFPVSLTALAPAEVATVEPFVVAAPFRGVVREILVDQGATINPGDPIIAFEDTEWRNRFEIADQSEAVAKARYTRASQSAIGDITAKREIAVAKAEYDLATAEKAYARDLLDKAIYRATDRGIAIYTDKRDWIGRPVEAGETILQIADPQKVRFSIDLPVAESFVLKENSRVKVFLDSNPLKPIEATLIEASYQPYTDKRNVLSYRVSALLEANETDIPRIGIQGTAQIYGNKAPLIYAVLRRPISALRQMTGW